MNNRMALYDGLETDDRFKSSTFRTSVDVINSETGEVIFKGLKNKVIISGSGFIARKLFDIDTEEVTPSYNQAMEGYMYTPSDPNDDNEVTIPDPKDVNTVATKDNHKVLLFCCGTDGCGVQNSQVYPVDYTKWIGVNDLVPFRCVPKDNDINDDLRKSYFGRSSITIGENEYIAYYFKRFESVPTMVQQYIDGTPVSSLIYDNIVESVSAETYVEMNLKITTQDIRDYFAASSGMDEARINSISLCTAYPVVEDGYTYFKDIRPLTKLNFPNEQFIDASKGIDIIYHIYM